MLSCLLASTDDFLDFNEYLVKLKEFEKLQEKHERLTADMFQRWVEHQKVFRREQKEQLAEEVRRKKEREKDEDEDNEEHEEHEEHAELAEAEVSDL